MCGGLGVEPGSAAADMNPTLPTNKKASEKFRDLNCSGIGS
jgi:hypothetical protein